MGLDAIEIVMQTEDEFGISLSDDEAGTVQTVDELHRLVLSKLDSTPSCLSSKVFYQTRSTCVVSSGASSLNRPSSDLESLLPEPTRRDKWNKIASNLRLDIRTLQYPARWRQRFFRLGALISAFMF